MLKEKTAMRSEMIKVCYEKAPHRALLRATGVLCVYGSGFGTDPEDGFFRVVYLASPGDLNAIFDLVADFTRAYLSR